MDSFFYTQRAAWKAKRIQQMMNDVGEQELYARPNGQVMMGTNGHLFLFDLNADGQLIKLDSADCVAPKQDNTIILE